MKKIWIRFLPTSLRKRLESSQSAQKIISNTTWLFTDKLFKMGVGLFVSVWVARYLGPEQFGTLNYVIALVSLFSVLSTLGLDQIVVRDLVKYPEQQNEVLGTTFILKLLGGSFALIVLVIVSSILKPEDNLMRLLVAIAGISMVVKSFLTIDLWFKSQVTSKYSVVSQYVSFTIASVSKVFLILKHSSLIAFVIVNLLRDILSMIGMIFFFKKTGKTLNQWRLSFPIAIRLINESWPLILSGLAVVVNMKIDQIMLGEMIDHKAVGTYSAAVRLSEVGYFIPMAIASSVFPAIVKSKQLDEKIYKSRIQNFYNLNATIAYGVSIPIFFLAPFIIHTLYGNAYAGAETIFAIHIWACLFVFIGTARAQYLITEGLVKFSFLCNIVGAFVNLGLNFILIPHYEGVGAAVATVVSYTISAYLTSFFHPRLFGIGLMQSKAFVFPIRYLIIFTKKHAN